MTKYTDEQLQAAMLQAGKYESVSISVDDSMHYVADYEIDDLRRILDHLPSQQDEWQECAFDEIRKGDRVRMAQAGRTTDFHLPVTEAHPTYLVFQGGTQCSYFQKANYYRIPAPVQHPDPEEHPVVINGNGTAWFWSGLGDEYHSPERPGEYKDRFTNWTPGEVVPKVVETND